MRAVVYARISSDTEGKGLGVARQLQACRELCDRHELTVVSEFDDNDTSVYRAAPRHGWASVCELIRSGDADVLVAWAADRLTRHPRELEDLVDLLESARARVLTVTGGEVDLSTSDGRMVARVVGSIARHESERKSERLRAKAAQLAAAGAVGGGGTRPFGYESDRTTVRHDEAAVIRELAERVLAGESLYTLAGELDARGIRSPRGNAWAGSRLRDMLMSARIAGLREHRGEVTATAVWPAIITPDQHYRLRAVLADPKRSAAVRGRPRRLLSGIATCGKCGAGMISQPRRGVPSYRCPNQPHLEGCGRGCIKGEPLDELVSEAVLDYVASMTTAEALSAPPGDAPLVAEAEALAARRRELAAMWAAGEISRVEWKAAAAVLDDQERNLDDRFAAVVRAEALSIDLAGVAGRWESLPTERRRAVILAVVERVVIGPARHLPRFDPERVSIVWRV